jgi:LAO/AO transport system kinase
VGQSEVELAGLADTTIVTMVPDAGDEIQTMKAGLMEIADIFVVNKADHVGADRFAKNLRSLSASRINDEWKIPVLKTIATAKEGISELHQEILRHQQAGFSNKRKPFLLAEKCWRIIQKEKMKEVNKKMLLKEITRLMSDQYFNVYRFAKHYF